MLNHMRPSAVSLLESGEYRCIKAINIVYLLFTESRRDQEEGGELDSHEEIRHFAGPGEIKRREVSWTLTKKSDILQVQARSRGGR